MLTALETSGDRANADRGLSTGGISLKGLMALVLLSYVLIILFPQAEPMTENAFNLPTAAVAASAASSGRPIDKRI